MFTDIRPIDENHGHGIARTDKASVPTVNGESLSMQMMIT
ncbi:hypothetical protein IFVP182_C260001 [Vibrio parahaemolyticus]